MPFLCLSVSFFLLYCFYIIFHSLYTFVRACQCVKGKQAWQHVRFSILHIAQIPKHLKIVSLLHFLSFRLIGLPLWPPSYVYFLLSYPAVSSFYLFHLFFFPPSLNSDLDQQSRLWHQTAQDRNLPKDLGDFRRLKWWRHSFTLPLHQLSFVSFPFPFYHTHFLLPFSVFRFSIIFHFLHILSPTYLPLQYISFYFLHIFFSFPIYSLFIQSFLPLHLFFPAPSLTPWSLITPFILSLGLSDVAVLFEVTHTRSFRVFYCTEVLQSRAGREAGKDTEQRSQRREREVDEQRRILGSRSRGRERRQGAAGGCVWSKENKAS